MTITLPQLTTPTPPVAGESYSCLDIVKGALRKLGVLASGREPRAVDRDDVFQALKGMYRQWINAGAFGRLQDVVPVSDYTACGSVRIYRASDQAELAITLPETVRRQDYWCDYRIYGSCWWPDTRRDVTTPRDCTVVTVSDAVAGQTFDFIYDGQLKLWQGLYDLALEDRAPLAHRDPQGLMAMLALQVADDFSAQVGPGTSRLAGNFQSALVTRFSMPAEAQPGIFM